MSPSPKPKPISTTVRPCPYCGCTHIGLLFLPMPKPVDGHTHYARCPIMDGKIIRAKPGAFAHA